MAASRAPTSAAWRIRAASLTRRWFSAGTIVGSVTALISRMMKITTRSSTRVKPLGVAIGTSSSLHDSRGLEVMTDDVVLPRLGVHG